MIVEIKGTGKRVKFPDGMSEADMLAALRKNFFEQQTTGSLIPEPAIKTLEPINPTLSQKASQSAADFLFDKGIISDRYGAQRIGRNISALAEFLPGIGDATAGDEFGRALAQGDKTGMALGALGVIPIVGDAAKILPMKGKAITGWTDLFDYTPEQLTMQAKVSDPDNVVGGIYTINKGKWRTEYYDDGTSALINNADERVMRKFNQDETANTIKNRIIEAESNKPEVKAIQEARQADIDKARARSAQQEEAYKMQHTAPLRSDNPSGDDLTDSFGDDIYSIRAKQYYGTGASYDDKAIKIIQSMRNNPEKEVTIYRAVPKSVKTINKTDWVTTTREYALDHMSGEDGWHILSKKVKARDIANDGNSIHEFGYDPI